MSVTTTVSAGTPPGTPAAGTGGQPTEPQTPPVDAAKLQAELDALKGQLAEKDRTAQYWFEKAKAGEKPAPAAKPAAAAEEEDDTDLLDVISTKGVKGLIQELRKRGAVVTKEEAQQMVDLKAGQVTKEQQLLKTYPELGDRESDFFKTCAGHYGELKQAGMPEAMAMELAAERTELQLYREGKRKTAQQKTDDAKAQKESERQARIKAQAGDRGGRPSVEDEEDDELTPEQKRIVANMGITEEAYKKRAKDGVQMRGR